VAFELGIRNHQTHPFNLFIAGVAMVPAEFADIVSKFRAPKMDGSTILSQFVISLLPQS
jgi:hypothetical protein